MAGIGLIQFARILGSHTVISMARKVGLNPPPPPISVRALVTLLRLPLQPTDLRLYWDVNVAGNIIFHPADEQGVPLNKTIQFDWRDPTDSPVRKAKTWQLRIKVTTTGQGFGRSPFSTLPGFGTNGFEPNTRYSWSVTPLNDSGHGPSSAVFTFKTSPVLSQKPNITVVYHPPAASAKFSIKGTGFIKNHVVHVRGVNSADLQHPAFGDTTSDSSGAIDMQVDIPCTPGTQLSFSANDERPDSHDLTGTLFSNTVTIVAS
jgi:hypothetical protein